MIHPVKFDALDKGYIFCSDYPTKKSCKIGVVERKRCSENDRKMDINGKSVKPHVLRATLETNFNGETPDAS